MDQVKALLSRLTLKQRISIVLAVLLSGSGILLLVHSKREGDYRPLYSSMSLEDAATVVQKLKESGVEYRLSENGTAVMVPSAKLAESRLALAAAGLPKTGRIGFELFDKTNFGATEFVEHINFVRALEGELERSVTSLADVEQARVHLTLPKDSVFLDQQQPGKASVVLKLRPTARISPQNVLAITHLVASAVEGLSPAAVSVVDMDGNLLTRIKRAADDGSVIPSETLEMQQLIERQLVSKIKETLDPLLGTGGYRAGASVECDVTSGDQQEETLDPTRSVMVSSQKTEDSSERMAAAGVPGTASNLPAPPPRSPSGGSGLTRRTEDVTYQTSRIIRHTRIPQGVVKRLSLAVIVNQTLQWEGDGINKRRVLVPPPPETLKSIKDLVAGVTGFSDQRGDQLIVETLPFESIRNAEPPMPKPSAMPAKPAPKVPEWFDLRTGYRKLLLPAGLAVALSLWIVYYVVRRMKRRKQIAQQPELPEELDAAATLRKLQMKEAEMASAGQLAAADDGSVELTDRVRQLAKRDPVAAVNILRVWLQDSEG